MRIIKFQITKAHGHLDLDVSFNSDLTFLTGINGSGKTTAVRGIMALLSPSFRDLGAIEYSEMSVQIEYLDQVLTVSARRSDDSFTLAVEGCGEVAVPIFRGQSYEPPARSGEQLSAFYRDQYATLSKEKPLEFLSKVPTPMFLDLERRGGSVIRRPRYLESRSFQSHSEQPFPGSLGEGLREAQELAEEANRSYLVKRQELTDALRKALILMAFGLERSDAEDAKAFPSAQDLERLGTSQKTVTEALRSLGFKSDEIAQQVDPFFERLRQVVTELSSARGEELMKTPEGLALLSRFFVLEPQERQIQKMVKRAEAYNKAVNRAHESIENYLGVVNKFFDHGGKRVNFGRRGALEIQIGDKTIGNLTALSSGERQLVVILTHISFNARVRQANVLIVDEPELSLHIKWQEMFVDAVRAADKDIQLIFATHSPSIIMDRVSSCVDLSSSRQ